MDIDVKTIILEQEIEVQNIEKKIIGNRYELEESFITRWMLIKDQQLMKLNLKIDVEPQMVKIITQLEIGKVLELEQLLKDSKMFLHRSTKI